MFVAAHDVDVAEVAGLEAGGFAVLDLHQAVDLGGVGHRAGDGELAVDRVHQAALHRADVDSPLARALLRKRLDDEVEVTLPSGPARYLIIAITYD